MKAIAEYFRDLAADDRYFGAEPPQPDTEMLHQIAERTIQRRVAAELAENGVILRQETPVEPEAPALAVEVAKADAPAPVEAPVASVMDSVADVPVTPQQTPVRIAPVVTPEIAPDLDEAPAAQVGGDTVAEKLQRIRAVVAREAAAPAPYSEDQHAEDFSSNEMEEDAPVATALFDTPIDAGYGNYEDDIAGVAVEPEVPAETPETDVSIDDAPEVAEPEHAETAKVETSEDTSGDTADIAQADEDEAGSNDVVAEVEIAPEAAEAEMQDEAVSETQPENEKVELEAVADTDETSDVAETSDGDGDHAEVEQDIPTSEAEPLEEASVDTEADAIDAAVSEDEGAEPETALPRTKPRRRIVVQKISRSEMESAQAAKEAELPPELEAELMAELAEVEAEALGDDTSTETSEVTADAPVAEAEAEIEAEDFGADAILARLNAEASEPFETPAEEPVAEVQKEAESATDDTDGDVLSKLLGQSAEEAQSAEVEKEVALEATSDVAESDEVAEPEAAEEDAPAPEAETDADEQPPVRKSFAAEAEDDAIERLMSTTSSRLDNDESSVRRASIAHLKAAVAATKADASITQAAEKREEEELDQYRDDLARVVRPQRPTSGGGRAERPAPLVLVSEQRIDQPEDAPDAVAASVDVRPRRITRGNLALQEEMEEQFDDAHAVSEEEDKVSFPEYAAKAGALELPDLLEAAAAHYINIEGAEHFTRPMLMRKLAMISGPEAPSREDGLRAFGTLLRTGKIVKTENGKFVLSKSSQFA